ncbi:MAG: methyl-accepting chemotaxis protein, partial [Cellvibrionaceae bacterium]|nr:methyl-accepting chemotaxis protein [Cellvibrionaceae bacterium]
NALVNDVNEMSEVRYLSYQAADELRQSSDDLTRLGRTYVVTGDSKYEKMYMDILDIRNGKKPRPVNYHTIYWDLVLSYGQKPKPDGAAVNLQEHMKKLGFSESEFKKLAEAQANSDGLVGLEVKAMNAVKGLYDDGSGNYSVKGTPDFAMARDLLHSNTYHSEKAKIMRPIDGFFTELEQRTDTQVQAALESARNLVWLSVLLLVAVVGASTLGYLLVSSMITSPIQNLTNNISEVERKRDLRRKLAGYKVNDINQISLTVGRLLNGYRGIIGTVNDVSQNVNQLSEKVVDIGGGNANLSSGQRTKLESISTAIEEMTGALRSVSESTNDAESHAADTEKFAHRSETILNNTVSEFERLQQEAQDSAAIINELAEESSRVGAVLEVIKGIAEQTNLLALNAAIEAARAGEQGRGFAVVADEVRSLARRTQDSTGEIEQMISTLGEKAKLATQAMTSSDERIRVANGQLLEARQAFEGVEDSVVKIHQLNSQIASATEQQLQVSEDI